MSNQHYDEETNQVIKQNRNEGSSDTIFGNKKVGITIGLLLASTVGLTASTAAFAAKYNEAKNNNDELDKRLGSKLEFLEIKQEADGNRRLQATGSWDGTGQYQGTGASNHDGTYAAGSSHGTGASGYDGTSTTGSSHGTGASGYDGTYAAGTAGTAGSGASAQPVGTYNPYEWHYDPDMQDITKNSTYSPWDSQNTADAFKKAYEALRHQRKVKWAINILNKMKYTLKKFDESRFKFAIHDLNGFKDHRNVVEAIQMNQNNFDQNLDYLFSLHNLYVEKLTPAQLDEVYAALSILKQIRYEKGINQALLSRRAMTGTWYQWDERFGAAAAANKQYKIENQNPNSLKNALRAFERIRNDRRVPKNFQQDSLHVTDIIKALLDDSDCTATSLQEFSGPELWDALKILTKLQMDTRLPDEVRTDPEVEEMAKIVRELINEKKFLESLDGNGVVVGEEFKEEYKYDPALPGSDGTDEPKKDLDSDNSNGVFEEEKKNDFGPAGSDAGTNSDGTQKNGDLEEKKDNKYYNEDEALYLGSEYSSGVSDGTSFQSVNNMFFGHWISDQMYVYYNLSEVYKTPFGRTRTLKLEVKNGNKVMTSYFRRHPSDESDNMIRNIENPNMFMFIKPSDYNQITIFDAKTDHTTKIHRPGSKMP